MRVLWTEHALRDLDNILLFYDPGDLRYGLKLCEGALEAADQLGTFPELGPKLYLDGIPAGYRWLLHRSLKLIYRVDHQAERVWVLRVYDARRDPDRLVIPEPADE